MRAGHVDVTHTCCPSGLVLDNGRANFFPDVAEDGASYRRKPGE